MISVPALIQIWPRAQRISVKVLWTESVHSAIAPNPSSFLLFIAVSISTNIQQLPNVLASVGALFSPDEDAVCRSAHGETS